MHEHALVAVAFGPALLLAGPEAIGVDEVGHDVDRLLHAEHEPGLVGEVLAHRGHRVGLFDREARGPHVAAIAARDGDVGAVQRCDEAEARP